mmetsp:Transcript_2904/g.3277  ORF Transcript_2904/g.3277 Transcript_2904/m.3277 type:complete len:116 (-) Transcript_2904:267-614(-)
MKTHTTLLCSVVSVSVCLLYNGWMRCDGVRLCIWHKVDSAAENDHTTDHPPHSPPPPATADPRHSHHPPATIGHYSRNCAHRLTPGGAVGVMFVCVSDRSPPPSAARYVHRRNNS